MARRRSRAIPRDGQGPVAELAWRRIDLHLHTPGSSDYQEPRVGPLEILQKAEARGLDIIAFTDHNSVAGYAAMQREVEHLELLEAGARLQPDEARRLHEYRRLRERVLVLPGFEFTATFGFHILGIFPEETTVRKLEHLLLQLNIPEEKLDHGTSEVGATTDVLRVYEIIAGAGGLVIGAHVNSTHGIAMIGLGFGGQTKIAYTQDPNLHALEVTDLESTSRRSTARFFNGSKPEYPRRMHCIQGSDAHRVTRDPQRPEKDLGVGDRCTEILLPEISFAALKDLFASTDFSRTRPFRPSDDPFDPLTEAREEGATIVQAFHDTPGVPRARVKSLLKDVVAFANTNGGVLYVGASADQTQPIRGVEGAPELAELIRTEAARQIVPPVQTDVETLTSEDKTVLVVTVPKGTETPYALEPGYIYVRQEGETTLALRDEIVQLVRAASAPETVGPDPNSTLPPRATAVGVPARTALPARAEAYGSPQGPQRNGAAPLPQSTNRSLNRQAAQQVAVQQAAAAEQERQQERTPVPRTGVEIIASTGRNGVIYHTVRDLRNRRVVRNVTRESARRLWRYAILQVEQHPVRAEDVHWDEGDERFGFWKGYRQPEGMRRYNLVYREGATAAPERPEAAGEPSPHEAGERLRVFYGVTEEGIDERWRNVLPADSELTEIYYDEPSLSPEGAEPLAETVAVSATEGVPHATPPPGGEAASADDREPLAEREPVAVAGPVEPPEAAPGAGLAVSTAAPVVDIAGGDTSESATPPASPEGPAPAATALDGSESEGVAATGETPDAPAPRRRRGGRRTKSVPDETVPLGTATPSIESATVAPTEAGGDLVATAAEAPPAPAAKRPARRRRSPRKTAGATDTEGAVTEAPALPDQ